MPNNVGNKLTIQCEDSFIMSKIKKMIIKEKNDDEYKVTMEILLPRSKAFADEKRFDFEWNLAVWGTKWDVYNYSVNESGDTITIFYNTAWSPNRDWVRVLCDYIDHIVGHKWGKEIKLLSVEHRYSDYPGNFGGIVKWRPRDMLVYKHYNSY
jgi:hypothetical protein